MNRIYAPEPLDAVRRSAIANASILIVDDNPVNLRLLADILSEEGYHLRVATNGERALVSAAVDAPDLILLDIRMPEMDGYDVCRRLKEDPRTKDTPIIFISALDDVQDKVAAFTAGGVDYITKPFQMEEVLARVRTHLSLRKLQKDLQDANRKMLHDLEFAAKVQSSFISHKTPEMPGWRLSVSLLPAEMTSGDFFDVMRLGNKSAGLLIADVVEKGVGAALYMAMSCALLRTHAAEYPHNPDRVFKAVNRSILEYTSGMQFVTVFLGALDLLTGELVYSNAGHPPPMLVNSENAGEVQKLGHTGPPLGILEDADWQKKSVKLRGGDRFVLYTDGVTEAQSPGSEECYGLDRLAELVRSNAVCPPYVLNDLIIQDVKRYTGDAPLADDVALMVLAKD